MKNIPIFDSLTHPTLAGTWGGKENTNSFDDVVESLRSANYAGACAVGLPGLDGYEHTAYAKACEKHPQLVPIAGFAPMQATSIDDELKQLKELGFKGIKLHPRISGLSLEEDQDQLTEIFNAAANHGLVVFLCTYSHCPTPHYPTVDPLFSIIRLVKRSPDTKIVLLHGGDVNLLRYSEFVRFSSNILLDLSFTINRYEGSSLDLDIAYLFRTLDRKICIGSDSPEYSPTQLRTRFEKFAECLPLEKIENIAFKNITSFIHD